MAKQASDAKKASDASAPVVGSGKRPRGRPKKIQGSGRRGRPKGSKNKRIKGGNIIGDIGHTFADRYWKYNG